jgi:hypothetical protein
MARGVRPQRHGRLGVAGHRRGLHDGVELANAAVAIGYRRFGESERKIDEASSEIEVRRRGAMPSVRQLPR